MNVTKSSWLLYLIFVSFLQVFLSCSPSGNTRLSGKYSSAHKREKANRSTAEERTYTYEPSGNTHKKNYASAASSSIRQEIVQSALTYKGTNYRPGGKSPQTGFDCSGFTGYVFTQNGIPISGPSDKLAQLGIQKPKDHLKPGDLVFFGNKDRISHVAIVATNTPEEMEIVHSTTSGGVKIDNITHSEYWQSRFLFGVDIISK